MLNVFQRACARAYGAGEFAHVASLDEARGVGDTLFAFLMTELGSREGCRTRAEAIRRLEAATADVDGVIDATTKTDAA